MLGVQTTAQMSSMHVFEEALNSTLNPEHSTLNPCMGWLGSGEGSEGDRCRSLQKLR